MTQKETLEAWRERMSKERFRMRVRAAARLRDVPPEVTLRVYGELFRVGEELARAGT